LIEAGTTRKGATLTALQLWGIIIFINQLLGFFDGCGESLPRHYGFYCYKRASAFVSGFYQGFPDICQMTDYFNLSEIYLCTIHALDNLLKFFVGLQPLKKYREGNGMLS